MYFEDRTVGGKNRILYTGVEFLFCWPDQGTKGQSFTMPIAAYGYP